MTAPELHHIAEDLACMEEQMAWHLITEIEECLAKHAAFEEYLVDRVTFTEHQAMREVRISNITEA